MICKSLLLAKVGRILLEWLPEVQRFGSVQEVPLDGDYTQTFMRGERVLKSYEYIELAQLLHFPVSRLSAESISIYLVPSDIICTVEMSMWKKKTKQ